jgi:uncharacterized protein (TIGR02270 family)
MKTDPPPPIRDILEEHLEEAAFLWAQREVALDSPRYTAAEVAAGPEERLFAHLAGLALGGVAVEEELLAPALGDGDTAKVAAAAAALSARGRVDLVRRAVKPDAPEIAAAIVRALALTLPACAERLLLPWLDEEAPPAVAVALSTLAARGAAPERSIRRALASSDVGLVAAGLRAAPALGEGARAEIEAAWGSLLPELHDAAVEAGLALGLRGAWHAARRGADEGKATPLDLLVLSMSGDPGDLDRIGVAAAAPERLGSALFAAGFSGQPRAAELCVARLADPGVAGLAGEAFRAVTGLVIDGRYAAPEPDEPEPLDDLADAGPAAGPEAELPVPDAMEVAGWWRDQRSRFVEGQRYVEGRPFSPDELLRAFVDGTTRRRGPIARELAIRSRGQYRIDTGASAGEQLRRARGLQLVARADFAQPFERLLRL